MAVLEHRVSDCVLPVGLICFSHERRIPNEMGCFRAVVLLIAVGSEQGQLHLHKARRASVFQTFGDNWEALIHILVFSAMSCVSHRSTAALVQTYCCLHC